MGLVWRYRMIDIDQPHLGRRYPFHTNPPSTPFIYFGGCYVDAEHIRQHIYRQHEQSHHQQRDDHDVSERFGYDLSNQSIFGCDLAVSAGEARAKAIAAIVVRHRTAHTLVPAGDIVAEVHSCLALHALPPGRARAIERVL